MFGHHTLNTRAKRKRRIDFNIRIPEKTLPLKQMKPSLIHVLEQTRGKPWQTFGKPGANLGQCEGKAGAKIVQTCAPMVEAWGKLGKKNCGKLGANL